jgi:hypothetical protein
VGFNSDFEGLSEKISLTGELALGEATDVSNTEYGMNERVKVIERCRGYGWEQNRILF